MLVAARAKVVGTDARTNVAPIDGVELVLAGTTGAARRGGPHRGLARRADVSAPRSGGGAGVRIWGEVELAVQALPTEAAHHRHRRDQRKHDHHPHRRGCSRRRKKVFTGGNLGEPLAAPADTRFDVVVLEVSSFQMERASSVSAEGQPALNITPDHLDRYPSEQAYAGPDGNSFVRQGWDDLAVVPAG